MKYAASFVGWSNTGKTTIIEMLIPAFRRRGYTVSALKRSHVAPDFYTRSKDTDRFFSSGADTVGYLSPEEGFLRFRRSSDTFDVKPFFRDCDILLCEGFRFEGHPLFEVVGEKSTPGKLKADPESVWAYIYTGKTPGGFSPPTDRPVLDARATMELISYLEEIWTGK